MSSLLALLAGAGAGLASVPHCSAMCGPLAACASARRPLAGGLAYQAARITAYGLVGALAGWGSRSVQQLLVGRLAGALVSWSVALALAAVAYRLWRAGAPRLVQIRRAPRPAARAPRRLLEHPALLGAMTALLPCGALYAALALAAGSGGPVEGMLTMTAFAITSGAGLVAVGALTGRIRAWIGRPVVARSLAALCLVAAIVFALRPIGNLRDPHGTPSCHGAAGPPAELRL